MTTVKPFAALRPKPELAKEICELPYDVLSSEEAREAAAGNSLSFFHVSKPEIDLPEGTDPYSPEVYEKGKENLQRLMQEGALQQDSEPSFYLYRQVMGQHSQVGVVAVASCEEYRANVVKKHEFTRPEKEQDRVRHIEALEAQTGPAFLTYHPVAAIDQVVEQYMRKPPAVKFTAADGVEHTAWAVQESEAMQTLEAEFKKVPVLYIADGHHRSAAAARVDEKRQGSGQSAYFLSVIFPSNQLQILPYNRVLKDLNGHSSEQLLKRLQSVLIPVTPSHPQPAEKHHISLYVAGNWHTFKFPVSVTQSSNPVATLDVSLLQEQVLEPVFGIEDPRTSKRIDFVGGIRGTGELEKLVSSGDYECAFSMYATTVDDLIAVSDADGIMPPKSTWFEPKLRDAMFCHLI